MGLLKVLFVILILIFPFGEVIRFDFENNVALKLNDIFLFLLVFYWLVSGSWKNVLKAPLFKPIGAFALIALLSLFVNSTNLKLQEFFVSSLYLFRWIFYAGVYFVVLGFEPRFKRRISILMIISGSFVVIAGYIQYFLYPSLRNLYYLGWDEHLYRMFSTFLDPNFAGAFFVLLFIFMVDQLFLFKKRNKYTYILFIMTVLTLFAIFLTYSRTAILMLVVGTITFLILRKKTRWVIAVIVVIAFFTFLSQSFLKSEGTNLLRITSSIARIESSKNAVAIFRDHPVLGVGFNSYRYAQKRYGFSQPSRYIDHTGAGTDNSFLFVLATTGIVGFLLYLFIWKKIMMMEIEFKSYSQVLFSSVFALFVGSFFINLLFYPFIMEWMWILVGLKENKQL